MSSSNAALSRTLQAITLTKIRELEKQRQAFAKSKNDVLGATTDRNPNIRERVIRLLREVNHLESSGSPDIALDNIRRWLLQSNFDSSISDSMLHNFEIHLRTLLDVQTHKLDMASLYSHLLTEWLRASNTEEAPLFDEPGSCE